MPSSGFPFPAAPDVRTSPTFTSSADLAMRRTLPGSVRASAGRKRGECGLGATDDGSRRGAADAAPACLPRRARGRGRPRRRRVLLGAGRAACWSVRRRGEAEPGWGTGDWVCEDVWPPPEPLPVTTIAWRLVHLCVWTDVYRSYAFEDGSLGLPGFEVPGTAARSTRLARPVTARPSPPPSRRCATRTSTSCRPAHWGGLLPIEFLVSTIAVEHVHHGAEITLLRDLRRGVARPLTP